MWRILAIGTVLTLASLGWREVFAGPGWGTYWQYAVPALLSGVLVGWLAKSEADRLPK